VEQREEENDLADLEDVYRTLGISPRAGSSRPTEEVVPSSAELIAAARRFHRRLRARLNEALEDVGISYAQYEVLEALGSDPNHHAGSIAGHLGTSRQAVSLLLRRLFDADLVDPLVFDRGVRGLRLTDLGSQVLARCGEALAPLHLMLGGRMNAEDRAALHTALYAAEAALRPPPRWF
jgi:DNA-binding MarR family transcriptional regulator